MSVRVGVSCVEVKDLTLKQLPPRTLQYAAAWGHMVVLQGYLAHKKTPTTLRPP